MTTQLHSFFELATELGISKRSTRIQWETYKNLPIKEGDNVVIYGRADLLAVWLIKYGLAASLKVFDDKVLTPKEHVALNTKLNIGYRNNKHLPVITNYFSNISYDNDDKNLIKNDNLIIIFNKDLSFISKFLNRHLFDINFYNKKYYIKLHRNIELHKYKDNLSIFALFNKEYLLNLPNFFRYSLLCHWLGNMFKNSKNNVKYKKSFPYKNYLYKDISVN